MRRSDWTVDNGFGCGLGGISSGARKKIALFCPKTRLLYVDWRPPKPIIFHDLGKRKCRSLSCVVLTSFSLDFTYKSRVLGQNRAIFLRARSRSSIEWLFAAAFFAAKRWFSRRSGRRSCSNARGACGVCLGARMCVEIPCRAGKTCYYRQAVTQVRANAFHLVRRREVADGSCEYDGMGPLRPTPVSWPACARVFYWSRR